MSLTSQSNAAAQPAIAVPQQPLRGQSGKRRNSPFQRRARLVVEFALELAGLRASDVAGDITLPLSAAEFQRELQRRYGDAHPDLAFRSIATVERARLQRTRLPQLPRVILRQGPPPRSPR
jgi:hypothetical protein